MEINFILKADFLKDIFTINDLRRAIKLFDNTSKKHKEVRKIVEKYTDFQELSSSSDSIAKVKIVSIEIKNNRCILANLEVEKQFKGERKVKSILLPTYVESGSDYLLFLRYTEDGVELAARNGAIVSPSDTSWSEYLKYLNKLNP